MGTQGEEAITLRREVGGRTGRGAAMLVAAGCALAGVLLGFGLGSRAGAPAQVQVVRAGGAVYAPSPCGQQPAPKLILIEGDDGAGTDTGDELR